MHSHKAKYIYLWGHISMRVFVDDDDDEYLLIYQYYDDDDDDGRRFGALKLVEAK